MVYSYYNIRYTYLLQKVLNDHKVLKHTCRTKVILQSILIEFIVVQKVALIWSSNYFWYVKGDNSAWLYFIVIFEVTSEIIPFTMFIYVLIGRISKHKELINSRKDFAVSASPEKKNVIEPVGFQSYIEGQQVLTHSG